MVPPPTPTRTPPSRSARVTSLVPKSYCQSAHGYDPARGVIMSLDPSWGAITARYRARKGGGRIETCMVRFTYRIFRAAIPGTGTVFTDPCFGAGSVMRILLPYSAFRVRDEQPVERGLGGVAHCVLRIMCAKLALREVLECLSVLRIAYCGVWRAAG